MLDLSFERVQKMLSNRQSACNKNRVRSTVPVHSMADGRLQVIIPYVTTRVVIRVFNAMSALLYYK